MKKKIGIALALLGVIFYFGWKSKGEKFAMTSESVEAGSAITWLGERTRLASPSILAVGQTLPEVELVNLSMKNEPLALAGKVMIISTLPSLDTPVCDVQTHALGETKELNPAVERVTISRDLPYAIRRFSEESKLKNIRYLSAYRNEEFGKKMGLELERNGLLARAIIVVDAQGIVRHLQIVPEIIQLPDMKKAFEAANGLIENAGTTRDRKNQTRLRS